jgi:CRISPR-associated protein (TIGR03986 family)
MNENGKDKSEKYWDEKSMKHNEMKYVTLPYDFILPQKWYPYKGEGKLELGLPRHDHRDQLSGYIQYRLRPESDLVVEIKEGKAGRLFLGGSQMRGRVRANLEILSQSYPHFINRTPMLFRDIAGDLKDSYKEKLDIQDGIEKSIQVGFLKKDGNEFYVVPATKYFADKYFVAIKEHKLINMKLRNDQKISFLYNQNSSAKKFEEINKAQTKIDRITDKIEELRELLKDELSDLQDKIPNIFIGKFNFTIKLKDIRKDIKDQVKIDIKYDYDCSEDLEKIKKELLAELNKLRTEDDKLKDFFDKMAERWTLKAVIDINYYKLLLVSKNKNFLPYQSTVYYKQNVNGGIDNITFNTTGNVMPKGYLFNSTNAGSKRSHYFIKEPETGKVGFAVPQDVIASYKQNHKKFRTTNKENKNEVKYFYNIFDDDTYQKLVKANPEGPIVFFQTGADKVARIGRTPYFKVPYEHSIGDILSEKKTNKIGYADALFGFIPDVLKTEAEDKKDKKDKEENEENVIKLGYKSRLRFSSIDIKGSFNYGQQYIPEQFLLPSPFASASAMYLKQTDGKELTTYENEKDKKPSLNGYKYYHVLDKVQSSKKDPINMLSTKGVIKNNNKNDGFYLEGKIHFHSLAPHELGLLLLSLDVKELLNSRQHGNFIKENHHIIQITYEQIGGAKAYGYGKIKVEITDLYLEKNGHSFESLILYPMEEQTERDEYIDAFINKMHEACEEDYFDYLKHYVKSKQEKDRAEKADENYTKKHPTTINWNNLNEKIRNGGGYPKGWRLWSRG